MPIQEPNYWPFAVLPQEKWSEQHWKEFHFLEDALRKGFRPCKYMEGEYYIESDKGRSAMIIYRGRSNRGRELWLNDHDGRQLSTWVKDFDTITTAALKWVEGDTIEQIVSLINEASLTHDAHSNIMNPGTFTSRSSIESTP